MQRASSKNSLFSITSDAPCSEVYNLGDRCKMAGSERAGTVAFIGRTQFAPGDWVGLVLDAPEGKNNGSVNGVTYFECEDKFGLFCRPSKLVRLSPSPVLPPASPSLSIANSTATTSNRLPVSPYARDYGYDLGERVLIPGGKMGVVKFLDKIDGDIYVGVLLDRPLGTCDGTLNGRRYFKCNPLYGTFVTADKAKKVASEKPSKMAVRHNKASTLRSQGGQGGAGSSVGWRGSQESLNSIGVSSTCSSRAYRASPKILGSKLSTTPTNIPHTIREGSDDVAIASLKTCLHEKEAHLERLSRELSDQQRGEAERVSQLSGAQSELQQRIAELSRQLSESEQTRVSLQSELDQRKQRIDELSFLFEEAEVLRLDAENTAKRVQEQQQNEESAQLATVNEEAAESVVVDASCQTEAEVVGKAPQLADAVTQSEQSQNSSTTTQTEKIETPKAVSEFACQTNTPSDLIHQQTQSDPPEKVVVKAADTQTAPASVMVELGVQAEVAKDSAEIFTQTPARQSTELACQTNIPPELIHQQTQSDPPEKVAVKVADTQTVPAPSLSELGIQVEVPKDSAEIFTQTPARPSTELAQQTDDPQVTVAETQTVIEPGAPKVATAEFACQTAKSAKMVDRATQDALVAPRMDASASTELVATLERDSQTDTRKEAANHAGTQTDSSAANLREVESQSDIRVPCQHGETQTAPLPATTERGVDPVAEQTVKPTARDNASQTLPPSSPPKSISRDVQVCIERVRSLAEGTTQTQPLPTTSQASAQTTSSSANIASTQTDSAPITSEKSVQVVDKVRFKMESSAASTQTPPIASPDKDVFVKNGGGKEVVVELDASKLGVASMPSVLALEERYRSQSEQVEKLDSTVSFLNSIISEQTGTINKLRAELNENRVMDEDGMAVDSLAGRRNAEAKRRRDYCDICEVFDQHDTAACPKREAEETERRSHNTSFSPASTAQRGGTARQRGEGGGVAYESRRAFCDICDAFDLHDTRQCPKLVPAVGAVSGNSINRPS